MLQDIKQLFMHTKFKKEQIKGKESIFAGFELKPEPEPDPSYNS